MSNSNPDRMRITVIAPNGIGGTEKAAALFAAELSMRGHWVEMLTDPSGPRTAGMLAAGVFLKQVPLDENGLFDYLMTARPDIVHQHVSGYWKTNPIYRALARMGQARPHLVETNVFGRLDDPEGDDWVDRRFFISATSGCQAFRRAGRAITQQASRTHLVIYYPLEILPLEPLSDLERSCLRRELGVSEEEVLAIRIGRPGHKWTDWELAAVRKSRLKGAPVRLLAMEPSGYLCELIQAGRYGDGILIRPATSDFAYLDRLYQAADVMIHAAAWGESFGYTLAEGMRAGLPVITRSTPWGDNAQVELVRNGKSGYVCASVGEMSRRLNDLIGNPALRRELGHYGRSRIRELSSIEHETDVLEEAMAELVSGLTGDKLAARRQLLPAFGKTLSRLEHDYSESFFTHPWDRLQGKVYEYGKCSMAKLGLLRQRFLSRMRSQ